MEEEDGERERKKGMRRGGGREREEVRKPLVARNS